MEEWRPIKGFEGQYEVSDYGHVRRILPDGTTRSIKTEAHAKNGSGFAQFSIGKREKRKGFVVARLVWETFIGPIPEGYVVTHRNQQRLDNNLRNLEIKTVSKHFKDVGGGGKRRTVVKLDRQGNVVKVYPSAAACAKAEGYSHANISNRCLGKQKEIWDFDFAYEDSVKSVNDALRRLGVKK